jgi:hypothetical protein
MEAISGGWFHTDHYVELLNGIFDNAISQVSNAGQVAILNELYNHIQPPMVKIASIGRKPNKTTHKAVFVLIIGGDKYNAVKNILEEIATDMVTAWDDAMGGDGAGMKMYLSLGANTFKTAIPSLASMRYGQRATSIRPGI